VWKTFLPRRMPETSGDAQKPTMTIHACSGCAGDYQDPGRTAGPDEGDDEGGVSPYETEWEGDMKWRPEEALEGGSENVEVAAPASEAAAPDDPLAD
jgi:hypothetical protein